LQPSGPHSRPSQFGEHAAPQDLATGSHTWPPRQPQSAGHVAQFSPAPHAPLPQHWPQSAGHVAQSSPASHWWSPQWSGAAPQWPPASHTWFAGQSPHEPPQPSSPHRRPSQAGVHACTHVADCASQRSPARQPQSAGHEAQSSWCAALH
jgi:hypothetical protein